MLSGYARRLPVSFFPTRIAMILRHRGKAFDSNTNLLEIYRPCNDCQKQAPNGAAHFPQADFWTTSRLVA
jgi:hypothetical protein